MRPRGWRVDFPNRPVIAQITLSSVKPRHSLREADCCVLYRLALTSLTASVVRLLTGVGILRQSRSLKLFHIFISHVFWNQIAFYTWNVFRCSWRFLEPNSLLYLKCIPMFVTVLSFSHDHEHRVSAVHTTRHTVKWRRRSIDWQLSARYEYTAAGCCIS